MIDIHNYVDTYHYIIIFTLYIRSYSILPGVVTFTTPASPLPIELVATTENVYRVFGDKSVIVYEVLSVVAAFRGHLTPEHDTV